MRIEIVEYRMDWPAHFAAAAASLRATLGDRALAIHHIGSTSVPGLAAKDVIDVQVTVAALGEEIVRCMVLAGHRFHADFDRDHAPRGVEVAEDELRKHTFTEREGERRVNVHVRVEGSFNQRYAVLFRDFLRSHPAGREAYAELKTRLAADDPDDRERYYRYKDPAIDMLMAGAEAWARATGWAVPPGDE